MAKDSKLPESVQRSIGAALRDHYREFVDRLPLNLVGLVRRVDAEGKSLRSEVPAPFDTLSRDDPDVLDPLTVRILVEAFDKAWRDLTSLGKNPATQEALALMLLQLVKEGERNPSELASKAVLKLIAA